MSDRLLFLRELIYDTAARIEGVGPLEEALKWGQPSFLTSESKSGSLIRVDQKSLVFHLDDEVPVRDLRRCIAMALTYRTR